MTTDTKVVQIDVFLRKANRKKEAVTRWSRLGRVFARTKRARMAHEALVQRFRRK